MKRKESYHQSPCSKKLKAKEDEESASKHQRDGATGGDVQNDKEALQVGMGAHRFEGIAGHSTDAVGTRPSHSRCNGSEEEDSEIGNEGGCFDDSSDEERFYSAKQCLLQGDGNSGDDEEENSDDDLSACSYYGNTCRDFDARVNMISAACSMNYSGKEVKGRHRSGCDDCGKLPGQWDDYYAVDHTNGVYNAPKLCNTCVHRRSNLLLIVTHDIQYFRKIKKVERQLSKKCILLDVFTEKGLYENGPYGEFRLWGKGELKTFQQHMAAEQSF